jgi:hypothetical protein
VPEAAVVSAFQPVLVYSEDWGEATRVRVWRYFRPSEHGNPVPHLIGRVEDRAWGTTLGAELRACEWAMSKEEMVAYLERGANAVECLLDRVSEDRTELALEER